MAALAIGAVISPAPAAASGPNVIYNVWSNQCLQPINGSTDQGAAIVQEPCNGGNAQQWNAVSVGGYIFHYVNVLSGMCLDAHGAAKNGTPIQQWACNSISNENWEPGGYNFEGGFPPLMSRVSGSSTYCLDIPNAQQTAGLAMQIFRCNSTLAQQWWIVEP